MNFPYTCVKETTRWKACAKEHYHVYNFVRWKLISMNSPLAMGYQDCLSQAYAWLSIICSGKFNMAYGWYTILSERLPVHCVYSTWKRLTVLATGFVLNDELWQIMVLVRIYHSIGYLHIHWPCDKVRSILYTCLHHTIFLNSFATVLSSNRISFISTRLTMNTIVWDYLQNIYTKIMRSSLL